MATEPCGADQHAPVGIGEVRGEGGAGRDPNECRRGRAAACKVLLRASRSGPSLLFRRSAPGQNSKSRERALRRLRHPASPSFRLITIMTIIITIRPIFPPGPVRPARPCGCREGATSCGGGGKDAAAAAAAAGSLEADGPAIEQLGRGAVYSRSPSLARLAPSAQQPRRISPRGVGSLQAARRFGYLKRWGVLKKTCHGLAGRCTCWRTRASEGHDDPGGTSPPNPKLPLVRSKRVLHWHSQDPSHLNPNLIRRIILNRVSLCVCACMRMYAQPGCCRGGRARSESELLARSPGDSL